MSLLPSSAWPMTPSKSVHSSVSLPPHSCSGTQNLDAQRKSEDKVLTCGHVTKMWETDLEFVSCEAAETIPNAAQGHSPPTYSLRTSPLYLVITVHLSDLHFIPLPVLSAAWGLEHLFSLVAWFHTTVIVKTLKSPASRLS